MVEKFSSAEPLSKQLTQVCQNKQLWVNPWLQSETCISAGLLWKQRPARCCVVSACLCPSVMFNTDAMCPLSSVAPSKPDHCRLIHYYWFKIHWQQEKGKVLQRIMSGSEETWVHVSILLTHHPEKSGLQKNLQPVNKCVLVVLLHLACACVCVSLSVFYWI